MTSHRRPVEWDFPLYQDDDQARLAELDNAVALAAETATRSAARVGDDSPPAALVAAKQAYNDFIDEVAERTFVVRLRTIGSRRFRDLLLDHPPRMVPKQIEVERALGEAEAPTVAGPELVMHPEDRGWGVNTDTFPRALIAFTDGEVSTIVAPEFMTVAEREAFVDDDLSDGELLQMWVACHERNRGGSADPKFLPRYDATPISDAT